MSYIQPVDPSELAARFSTEDTLEPIHKMDDSWVVPRLEKIKSVLDRLPDRETDLIRLYFFMDKKQMDIAEIFGITQAAVSYRIKRALARLRFLVDMPDMSKEEIYTYMLGILPTDLDAKIFEEMYETTCQSEVALRLGITQGRVRHRYIKNLKLLGETFLDRCISWAHPLQDIPFEVREVIEQIEHIEATKRKWKDEDFEVHMKKLITSLMELNRPSDESLVNLKTFAQVYLVFVRIRYNFNILREVKLPKWSNRASKTIM